MKTSTQLKAKVRNLAVQNGLKPEVILRNFFLERFLERIAVSPYRDKFILKGGMLIGSIAGLYNRTTMDCDTTIAGFSLSKENLHIILMEIMESNIEDNVEMHLISIDDIHEDFDYPGLRAVISAQLDKTKQTIKIDITTGDVITPAEIEYPFQLMFVDRKINVLAYNLETVLAEKLETILSRNVVNTRMRDYYDVWLLSNLKKSCIEIPVLNLAFTGTAQKRGTYHELLKNGDSYMDAVCKDIQLKDLWNSYRKKNPYVGELDFEEVMISVHSLWTKIRQISRNEIHGKII